MTHDIYGTSLAHPMSRNERGGRVMKYKQFLLEMIFLAALVTMSACGTEGGPSNAINADNALETNDPAIATNTASAPSEMSAGDIFSIMFDSESPGMIDFEDTDRSAQFILSVSSLDPSQSSPSVQLSDESSLLKDISAPISEDSGEPSSAKGGSASGGGFIDGEPRGLGGRSESASESFPPSYGAWLEINSQEALDQQLRAMEQVISQEQDTGSSLSKAMIAQKDTANDDTETFYVLKSLSSLNSYTSVNAEVKCTGNNVIFYVDTEVFRRSYSDLTDEDVETLCKEFDRVAEDEIKIFGDISDVNGDGKLTVLMTPQINRIGALGGGIITGFFYAYDLLNSNYSNQQEIIYVMVPDSDGIYGISIPKSFAMDNLLTAVLPHELQHAINYNQKVLVNNGSAEENWLSEGLAHLAEDILGYGQENIARYDLFLRNSGLSGPMAEGFPNLAERGASYLFLRYLYEQSEDPRQFVASLLNSNLTGAENVEAAFAGISSDFDQVSEFLLRWSAALVMSSFNLSADPRFTYKERSWNSETKHWEGVCLNCNAEDGRGTVVGGVTVSKYYGVMQLDMESAATKFYQITSFPNKIKLAANTTGKYGATLIRFK